jgi:hypothetical protein
VLLAHAREGESGPLTASRVRNGYNLKTRASWLKSKPLTRHLLTEEIENWKKAGYRFSLEEEKT